MVGARTRVRHAASLRDSGASSMDSAAHRSYFSARHHDDFLAPRVQATGLASWFFAELRARSLRHPRGHRTCHSDWCFLHALVFSPHIPTRQAVFIIGFLFVGSTLFAFAEEFGWRGFLLPKLLPLGVVPALLISGVCWFAWELPLVLFGLLDTTLLPINAPITLICHLLQDVSVGVLFGFLRIRYNSLPLSTFAHGFLNTMGAFAFLFFEERNPMLGDFAGPIGTVILLLLAAFVLVKCSKIRMTDSMSAPELRKPGGAI